MCDDMDTDVVSLDDYTASDVVSFVGLPNDMIREIFKWVQHLHGLFTVSKRMYEYAYAELVGRIVSTNDPLLEIYIQLISMRSFADETQMRVRRNAINSQIEMRYYDSDSEYEAWLQSIEDDEHVDYEYEPAEDEPADVD